MKRLLSLALAASLLMGTLPGAVFAEEIPSSAAESTAPENQEPTLETVPETTAESERNPTEETKTTEETVPETTETRLLREEEIIRTPELSSPDLPVFREGEFSPDLPDGEQLLEAYVENSFYGEAQLSFFGTAGRDSLKAASLPVYDELKTMLISVADGSRTLGKTEEIVVTFTAQDLGLSRLWSGKNLTEQASEAFSDQMKEVLLALLEDHPYDCYWVDKGLNMQFVYGYYPRRPSDPEDLVEMMVYFEFPVAPPYVKQGGIRDHNSRYCIEADPAKTGVGSTARKAGDYARTIVRDSDGLEDWKKLNHYREVICREVSYDMDAANRGPTVQNGSTAWQLISVFDQNPGTNVVCEGYSKAFQYLCDLSSFQNDVECFQDTGTMHFGNGGSGPHMWNVVSFNGRRMLADVTNSDTGTAGADGSLFLVFTEHIENGFQVGRIRYTGGKYLPDELTGFRIVAEKNPTCQEKGMKAHLIGPDGRLYLQRNGAERPVSEKELEIPALGHLYEITYNWSADGKACRAERICRRDASHRDWEEGVVSSRVTIPAGCETRGKTTYTASFKADWAKPQERVLENIEPTGHRWTMEYRWDRDRKTCTAVRVCSNNSSHNEKSEGTVTSRVTTPAGCETKGSTTYTATFSSAWAETQQITFQDIEALGHDYRVSYDWSEDGKTCRASAVCSRDPGHRQEETAQAASRVTTPAGCETRGKTTYTASFKADWAKPQEKVLEDIPALGHDYRVSYNWSEDGKTCRASAVCSRDPGHRQEETAQASARVTTPAGCETRGKTTYTASFKADWAEPQTKVLEDVEPLGHRWTVTYSWSRDGSTCQAVRVCGNDAKHNVTEQAVVTSKVTTPASCGRKGCTTYTAAFKAEWAETQKKVLEDIPATGKHVYDNDQDDTCNVCGQKRKVEEKTVPIYRLYNPYTGEHLLSNNETEKNSLVKAGWNLDGVAWNSVTEGTTVYRLYNPYDGSHLYSRNQTEIQNCLKLGWKMDGPVSHSASKENGTPIYRLFNPYVKAHYHLFSTSQAEISMLTRAGWILEGIAWYAAK